MAAREIRTVRARGRIPKALRGTAAQCRGGDGVRAHRLPRYTARVTEAPTAAKFDEYASEYDRLLEESIRSSGESHAYFQEYKVERLLRLGIEESQPILDFGCGVGALTEHLAQRFSRVEGYDPSAKSLEVARARVPGVTFHESQESLPNAGYRAVVLSGVLHHVPKRDREAVLTSVRQKLAPGGRLVIFEHNPLNPLTRRAVVACSFDDDAILLWPWELRRLPRRSGFSEVRVDYIVFFPRRLAKLRPLEPRLGWLFLGAQTMTTAVRA